MLNKINVVFKNGPLPTGLNRSIFPQHSSYVKTSFRYHCKHVIASLEASSIILIPPYVSRFMLIVSVILTVSVSLGILLNHPDYSNDVQSFVDGKDEKFKFREILH